MINASSFFFYTLETRERRIITNASFLFFKKFGNKGKENHNKCVILCLCTLGTRERRIITNASSFIFVLYELGKGGSLQMHHPLALDFGKQGKENHYKCIILHLWTLRRTRERKIIINASFFEPGKGESLFNLHVCTLGTRERRIIINASSFIFVHWERGKGEIIITALSFFDVIWKQ